MKETIRPTGMKLTKISVPFGAIGIIYEARISRRLRPRGALASPVEKGGKL